MVYIFINQHIFFEVIASLCHALHLRLFSCLCFAGLIPTVPIFFDGYAFKKESHLCTSITKIFSSAIHIIFVAYLISSISVEIIHRICLYHVRQSTRRVINFVAKTAITTETTHHVFPNFKCQMKAMRNMLILYDQRHEE